MQRLNGVVAAKSESGCRAVSACEPTSLLRKQLKEYDTNLQAAFKRPVNIAMAIFSRKLAYSDSDASAVWLTAKTAAKYLPV